MLQAPQEEISTLSSTSCRAWISADPFAVWTQGSPSVRSVPTPRITAVPFLSWRASLQVLPILLLLLLFATWCLSGNDVPLNLPFQRYKIQSSVSMVYRPGLLFLKNSIPSIGILLLRWTGPAGAFISCEMKHWKWVLHSSILVCLTNSSSLKTFTLSQLVHIPKS